MIKRNIALILVFLSIQYQQIISQIELHQKGHTTFVDENNFPMLPSYTLTLLDKLKKGENIIFTKYGDGEYACMNGNQGYNIDQDSYHAWLGERLKQSLVSLSRKKNTYIGKWWWWEPQGPAFCDAIAHDNNVTIPWTYYHLFMNDDEFLKFDYMYKVVEFIVTTKRKKIVVGNHMNSRLVSFFRANTYIEIPQKNWSYDYEKWKNEVEKHIEENCIVLISAGLCSKVLIDDITNNHNITCIDLGSSFDLLARRVGSRDHIHTYNDEIRYYKNILPDGWK